MNKIIGIIITLSTLIGTAFAVDARYTQKTEFIALAQQYQIDKIESKIDALTRRSWQLEDRLQTKPDDKQLLDDKRQLQLDIDNEKTKLQKMQS